MVVRKTPCCKIWTNVIEGNKISLLVICLSREQTISSAYLRLEIAKVLSNNIWKISVISLGSSVLFVRRIQMEELLDLFEVCTFRTCYVMTHGSKILGFHIGWFWLELHFVCFQIISPFSFNSIHLALKYSCNCTFILPRS